MSEDIYKKLIEAMVKAELNLVGKVAIRVANNSGFLKVDENGKIKSLRGSGENVFKELYALYKDLGFGLASVVIKKAISPIVREHPEVRIPEELKR